MNRELWMVSDGDDFQLHHVKLFSSKALAVSHLHTVCEGFSDDDLADMVIEVSGRIDSGVCITQGVQS